MPDIENSGACRRRRRRVADPKLLISDPDPTWRVILDLYPAHGSFRIRIWILVCEIFVKFLHLKSECTFKGHFCAEIELFMLNSVFITAFVLQEA